MESNRNQQTRFTSLSAQVRCKDGSDRWFQITAHPEKRVVGDYHLIVLIETDTPDQVIQSLQTKSERLFLKNKDLKISEQLLAETQRIAKIGSWEINYQDSTIKWSDEMYHLLGEDPEIFQPTLDDFYSKFSQSMIEELIQTSEPGSNVFKVQLAENDFIYLETFIEAIYDKNHQVSKVLGSSFDITDKVNLQNQSDELADLIRVAHQELYIVDYDTDCYLYANESASINTGYTNDEILSFTIYDLNPMLTPKQVKYLKEVGDDINSISNVSLHRCKDGSTYPVHDTLQRISYKGKICYAIFDADISALHAAQEALKTQLNLLQKIIDTVPVRLFWKDLNCCYLGANKLFLQDAELKSKNELIGKTDKDMVWANSNAEKYRKDDNQVLSKRKSLLQ